MKKMFVTLIGVGALTALPLAGAQAEWAGHWEESLEQSWSGANHPTPPFDGAVSISDRSEAGHTGKSRGRIRVAY